MVTRFASGLDHPRVIHALPNGDVLVTLTRAPSKDAAVESDGYSPSCAAQWKGICSAKADRAARPPQLVLLRDADGNGTAEQRHVLRRDLDSPSGIAWRDGTLYVANHDALLSFPMRWAPQRLTATPRKLMDLPAAAGTGCATSRSILMAARFMSQSVRYRTSAKRE
jgi:glucose/arabinose dehydrogenase